ncbi:Xaa-Pro aminopeptidase 1, partial [Pseudolycoriella hygida]
TQANYVSQSFKTISASGPNAAIIHYFPTAETNRALSINETFLLDSGSHYLDGTTDITRTLHFGDPNDRQMECYTRVLKGHIAVATAKFPYKTKGHVLDSFARAHLWNVGLDYGHGTGHGIGAYLNVGEGPHSAAVKHNVDDPGLRANMFMSNEPGYYEKDEFGIRLENIVRVVDSPKFAGFLELDTISFVPFQRKLIETNLLTKTEVEWLNDYHAKCALLVGNYIMNPDNKYENVGKVMNWLEEQTTPITFTCDT